VKNALLMPFIGSESGGDVGIVGFGCDWRLFLCCSNFPFLVLLGRKCGVDGQVVDIEKRTVGFPLFWWF
jgi:hypothetical protein